MAAIRRYLEQHAEAVWRLHVEGLEGDGAYGGDGPWDDDVRDVTGAYLENHASSS